MRPASIFVDEQKKEGRKFVRCDICLQLFPLVIMHARGIRHLSTSRGGLKSLWGGDSISFYFCSPCVRKMYKEVEAKKNNSVPNDGVDGLEIYYDE